MKENSQDIGIESIYDVNSVNLETDRPYIPRGMGLDVNQAGISGIMNQVDNGLFEGPAMPTQSQPYYHNGQHNPNVYQQPENNQSAGIDLSEVKNVMGQINNILPKNNGSYLGDLGEEDIHSVAIAIKNIESVIATMGEDLEMWVPNNIPGLEDKLRLIGKKIIPYLKRYIDAIRNLE